MTKTADLFLDKANEYKTAFENILKAYVPSNVSPDWKEDPKHLEQQQKIADLKFKTKLLFTEFDKGELFLDKIKSIDTCDYGTFDDEQSRLPAYNQAIDLFIDHLNTFRR